MKKLLGKLPRNILAVTELPRFQEMIITARMARINLERMSFPPISRGFHRGICLGSTHGSSLSDRIYRTNTASDFSNFHLVSLTCPKATLDSKSSLTQQHSPDTTTDTESSHPMGTPQSESVVYMQDVTHELSPLPRQSGGVQHKSFRIGH